MKKRNYLRVLLSNKGIKTAELAKLLNIKPATLNKKINGDVKFSEKDIKILLEALNMTYEQVFSSNISIVSIDGNSYIVNKSIADQIGELIEKSKEVS